MKKQIFLLLLIATVLTSCIGHKEVSCPNLMCTQEFRSISVKFVDADGKPVEVTEYRAINTRTKMVMSEGKDKDSPVEGVYVIASDSNLKDLSENGDIITVSAKNASTKVKKEAEFKIVGGVCSCHVHKVSGPDEIVFD